jgi:hypothetical protein
MQQMVDSLQSSMRLLVASVKSPDDIVALASQASPCSDVHMHHPQQSHQSKRNSRLQGTAIS